MSSPGLANVLTWGLLQFPELFNDIPMIMASLDAGQIISPTSLGNKALGRYLEQLLRHLPLKHLERQGWCKEKDSPIISISGYILNELLLAKSIVQPSDLTPSQLLASRSAPAVLRDAVIKYPDLKNDIPALLSNLSEGGSIQLGGMENEEVSEILGGLLTSLGVKVCESDDENDEDGSHTVKNTDIVERSALVYMVDAFKCAEVFDSLGAYNENQSSNQNKETPNSSSSSSRDNSSRERKGRRHDTNTSSKTIAKSGDNDSNSSSSSDDDDSSDNEVGNDTDDGDERNDSAMKGKIHAKEEEELAYVHRVGPSMPSSYQLASAQEAAERYKAIGKIDEDDDFGPVPRQVSVLSPSFSSVLPLGFTGASSDEINQFENIQNGNNGYNNKDEKNDKKRGVDEREEWMMNPGEDRAIAGFETFGVSRKFQTGKKAKKTAAAITDQREAYEESMKNSEESQRTQAILEEFKEKRGASLMDRHVAKKADQPKIAAGGRRAFDRELDVLSRKEMGKNQVEALVQHAKELDTRFDKGSVQRSFL